MNKSNITERRCHINSCLKQLSHSSENVSNYRDIGQMPYTYDYNMNFNTQASWKSSTIIKNIPRPTIIKEPTEVN